MVQAAKRRVQPELKQLVMTASKSLACLEADRLEELALECAALNRDSIEDEPKELARQAREAVSEMAVFAHVLAATGANLEVMHRLCALRSRQLEYRPSCTGAAAGSVLENPDGDD